MGCNCNKKVSPGFFRKIANGIHQLVSVAQDEIKGENEKVSPEVFEQRVLTCGRCEHLIHPTFQCGICLCFVRQKAKLAKMQCPLNIEEYGEPPRWLAVTPEETPPTFDIDEEIHLMRKERIERIIGNGEDVT